MMKFKLLEVQQHLDWRASTRIDAIVKVMVRLLYKNHSKLYLPINKHNNLDPLDPLKPSSSKAPSRSNLPYNGLLY